MPPSHPQARRSLWAFLLIAAVALLLVAAFAWAAGWIGGRRISGGDVVAALEDNGGKHPGYRRAHAKGLCFSGSFAASGAGSELSTARALKPGSYPVIGRFSTAGGNPLAGDGRNVFHSTTPRSSRSPTSPPSSRSSARPGPIPPPASPIRR
jgi:catalase